MTTRSCPSTCGWRLLPPESPPVRPIPKTLAPAWIAGAALLLAACGSDDAGTNASPEATGGSVLQPIRAAGAGGGQAGSGGVTNAPDSGTTASGGAAGGTQSGGASNGGTANGGAANGGAQPQGTGGAPPAPGTGVCCSAHGGKGCNDASIQACVCQNDPRCCSEKWDDVCVALVGGLGCGTCKADCCTENATPGCGEASVESCVCAKNADCCNNAWDSFCVLLVTSTAGGAACGTCN
jgi:hypothetical protein